MNFVSTRVLRSSVLFAGASLLSVAAAAQTAPAPTGEAPPATQAATEAATGPSGQPTADIIVTAQRRSESLQKVPMTVNVATGEQLQKLNLFDFKDVTQLAPGLELTNNDGRSNIATLRGITFDPDQGTAPAVDIYFNEIPVDAQTAFTAVYDVNQIEVLRGPQGLFRGRTSPAGAITLATRRPNLDDPEGYFNITGSNRSAVNAQGAASVPLVPGKIALRAAALVDFNKGNQVRDINLNNRRSNQQTLSARLSLALQPTDGIKVVATYQHLYSDTTPFIAVFGPGNTPYASRGDTVTRSGPALTLKDRRAVTKFAPRFTNKTDLLTVDAEVNLTDNIVWSTNAGYQNTLLKQTRDQDTGNALPGYSRQPSDFGRPTPGAANPQLVDTPYKVFTVDSRITSSGEGFFNWMVGGYYTHQDNPVTVQQQNDQFFAQSSLPIFPGFSAAVPFNAAFVDVNVGVPGHSSSTAGFASVRLNFTDHLRLEAGARYTHAHVYQQSILGVCVNPAGFDLATLAFQFGGFSCSTTPTIGNGNDVRNYNFVTGGANLSYDVSPNLTAYVAYGHTYRPGSAAVGVTYIVPQSVLLTQPEKSDSIEVGLKASMLNRRVSLNVDAFYQKYKNYISHINGLNVIPIAPDPNAGTVQSIVTNTNGDAITKGVEAQITGRLTRDLDLGLNASYVDAHYDNAIVPCNVFAADGVTPVIPAGQNFATCRRNDRIAEVPKFTATVNGEYRFHVGDLTPFVRTLVSYRPGYTSQNDNYKYRDFTNVSLFVGIRGNQDRWELSAYSKNLLNQTRALRVSDSQLSYSTIDLFGTNARFNSGYRSAVITNPREFGVTGRISW